MDKQFINLENSVLIESYYDVFFEKLFLDGYLVVENILNDAVKYYFTKRYYDIEFLSEEEKRKRNIIKNFMFTGDQASRKQNFSKKISQLDLDQLTGEDKLAIITAQLSIADVRSIGMKIHVIKEIFIKNKKKFVDRYVEKMGEKLGLTLDDKNDILKLEIAEEKADNNGRGISILVIDPNMKFIKVKSLKDMKGNGDSRKKTFYRGHTDANYQLLPSIVRTLKGYKNEKNICENSLVLNPEEYLNTQKNHLDILKKMQHYGIPTRVLDITEELAVAAYFATETNSHKIGEIIIFEEEEENIKYTRSDNVSVICSLPFLEDYEKKVILKIANRSDKVLNAEDEEEENCIQKLVHEISSEKPAFLSTIKVSTFNSNFIVIPTRDNKRIMNQSGSFIVSALNMTSYQNPIGKQRKSWNCEKKEVYLLYPEHKKDIKQEIYHYGIKQKIIYPEINEVANYLKKEYL